MLLTYKRNVLHKSYYNVSKNIAYKKIYCCNNLTI